MLAGGLFALAARISAEDAPRLAGLLGISGAVVLAVGLLVRRSPPATLGIAMLGAAYGVSLAGKGLDPASPLFAGGLVLVAELAFWALEPGAAVRFGRAATARRFAVVSSVAIAGALLASLLLAVASTPLRGGVSVGIAGVAAIAAILALGALLARSLRDG